MTEKIKGFKKESITIKSMENPIIKKKHGRQDHPFMLERNCRRRGILGCWFTIDGDKIIDAAMQVESFDLRLLNDTLFMSIDQTMEFNRDLKTTSVQKVTIRNKYVKSK